MRHPSKTCAILGAAIVSCGLSAAVGAQSIGVNFVGGGGPNTGSSLAATDIAGVVPQGNFNNETGGTQTTPQKLNLSTGVDSGASVTWKSPNTWSSGTPTTTPNGALLNGYLDSNGTAAGGAMVTVTNVPFKAYDVIVYFNTDAGTPRVGDYEVVTPAGTVTQQVPYTKSSVLTLAPPLPDNTGINGKGGNGNPAAGSLAGTYLIFPNLTGSTLTLESNQASLPLVNNRAPISGFQIYGIVPEPGTLGMLTVLGGLALRRSRRKNPGA